MSLFVSSKRFGLKNIRVTPPIVNAQLNRLQQKRPVTLSDLPLARYLVTGRAPRQHHSTFVPRTKHSIGWSLLHDLTILMRTSYTMFWPKDTQDWFVEDKNRTITQ